MMRMTEEEEEVVAMLEKWTVALPCLFFLFEVALLGLWYFSMTDLFWFRSYFGGLGLFCWRVLVALCVRDSEMRWWKSGYYQIWATHLTGNTKRDWRRGYLLYHLGSVSVGRVGYVLSRWCHGLSCFELTYVPCKRLKGYLYKHTENVFMWYFNIIQKKFVTKKYLMWKYVLIQKYRHSTGVSKQSSVHSNFP